MKPRRPAAVMAEEGEGGEGQVRLGTEGRPPGTPLLPVGVRGARHAQAAYLIVALTAESPSL